MNKILSDLIFVLINDYIYPQNSHALCDIGLSTVKRIVQKVDELQGLTAPVTLPVALYRPYEKKEGDNSSVSSLLDDRMAILRTQEEFKIEAYTLYGFRVKKLWNSSIFLSQKCD